MQDLLNLRTFEWTWAYEKQQTWLGDCLEKQPCQFDLWLKRPLDWDSSQGGLQPQLDFCKNWWNYLLNLKKRMELCMPKAIQTIHLHNFSIIDSMFRTAWMILDCKNGSNGIWLSLSHGITSIQLTFLPDWRNAPETCCTLLGLRVCKTT